MQIRYVVNARRWFNKRYGNTYHTVSVTDTATGKQSTSGITYGYGSAYRDTAKELINSECPDDQILFQVSDVERKSDL